MADSYCIFSFTSASSHPGSSWCETDRLFSSWVMKGYCVPSYKKVVRVPSFRKVVRVPSFRPTRNALERNPYEENADVKMLHYVTLHNVTIEYIATVQSALPS